MDSAPRDGIRFEVGRPSLEFECGWGVYMCGGGSSVCYATSYERALFIVSCLNRLEELGELGDLFDVLSVEKFDGRA